MRNFVCNGLNVVVDWVIQHEIEWLCKNLSDLNVEINYVVLTANQDTLIERLERRGDSQLVDRTLFLLNQMKNSPANKKHICDTTFKEPSEIVKDIVSSQHFSSLIHSYCST